MHALATAWSGASQLYSGVPLLRYLVSALIRYRAPQSKEAGGVRLGFLVPLLRLLFEIAASPYAVHWHTSL